MRPLPQSRGHTVRILCTPEYPYQNRSGEDDAFVAVGPILEVVIYRVHTVRRRQSKPGAVRTFLKASLNQGRYFSQAPAEHIMH